MAKTNAEKCRDYYYRKKAARAAENPQKLPKIKKTGVERARAYRQRKKMLAQKNKSFGCEILVASSTSNPQTIISEPLSHLVTASTNLTPFDVTIMSSNIADHVGDYIQNSIPSTVTQNSRKFTTVAADVYTVNLPVPCHLTGPKNISVKTELSQEFQAQKNIEQLVDASTTHLLSNQDNVQDQKLDLLNQDIIIDQELLQSDRVIAALKHRAIQRDRWIEWIKKINGKDWQPTKNHRICSRHFVGNEASPTSTSPSYLPTIQFRNNDCDDTNEKTLIERFHQNMQRRTYNSAKKTRMSNSDKNFTGDEFLFKMNKEVQAQMSEINYQNPFGNDSKLFLCHQITYSNKCDAEVQVYIPEDAGSSRTIREKTTDECCENSNQYGNNIAKSSNVNVSTNNISTFSGGFHGYSSITNDEDMLDFCGVTQATFDLLLQILNDNDGPKEENKNQLMMFLIKLKTGLSFSVIAVFFGVEKTTVSQVFFSLLQTLKTSCNNFIFWPCRDVVQETMPDSFKQSCKNCRVILDCIEIEVDEPNSMEARVHMYSNYTKEYTLKALVGCTPSGAVSIVSKCYGGQTTNCQITDSSGILDLLEDGDTILADERFSGVQVTLNKSNKNVTVITSPSVLNNYLPTENVDKIAHLRIQISNIIQRLQTYRILDKFSECLLSYADEILFMCAVLVNLQPTNVKSNDNEEDN